MKNKRYVTLKHLSVPSSTTIGEKHKVKIVVNDHIDKNIIYSAYNLGVLSGKVLSNLFK